MEHVCIADASPNVASTSSCAQQRQLQEVAGSHETAATTIRQAFEWNTDGDTPRALDVGGRASLASASWRYPVTGVPDAGPVQILLSPPQARFAGRIHSPAMMGGPGGIVEETPTSRLEKENWALRNALSETAGRLAELEGEQQVFMAEGVFDLVNSVALSRCDGAPALLASEEDFELQGGMGGTLMEGPWSEFKCDHVAE